VAVILTKNIHHKSNLYLYSGIKKPGIMVDTYNPSTPESKAGRLRIRGLSQLHNKVLDQPGQCSETVSQKKKIIKYLKSCKRH
jgi:hypothetical protein